MTNNVSNRFGFGCCPVVFSRISVSPHGQDDLGDLRSIFEVSHLRKHALFLNTQCVCLSSATDVIELNLRLPLDRMPVPVGHFISGHVYNGQLKTEHSIVSPKCVHFIDCKRGREAKKGHSYVESSSLCWIVSLATNISIRISMKSRSWWRWLASTLHERSPSVLLRLTTHNDPPSRTPSNATNYRGRINASTLILSKVDNGKLMTDGAANRARCLPGNEDDHIIISLTRSEGIGFLKENRRTNVMLTRCRKSMMICTSQEFLSGVASSSLVAALADRLGPSAWIDSRAIQFNKP